MTPLSHLDAQKTSELGVTETPADVHLISNKLLVAIRWMPTEGTIKEITYI